MTVRLIDLGFSQHKFRVSAVSKSYDLGNKTVVDEEAVMDVIVWAESEERERWWRQVVGLAPTSEHGVAADAGEPAAHGLSATSRMRVSVRSFHGVTAA